jgi:AcrR family transcriptional regulator
MAGLREEKKQLKRQAILDAGMRLFSIKGYENTSITDLAVEAGVGKGTIYSYFKTKREIFLAFCREQLYFINEEIVRSACNDANVVDQMMAVFCGTFRFIKEDREFGRLMLRESFFPGDRNLEQSRKIETLYIEMLVPILERGKERGELRPDLDLHLVIGHFYGLYLITISAWLTERLSSGDDFFKTLEKLFNQAMHGLAPA